MIVFSVVPLGEERERKRGKKELEEGRGGGWKESSASCTVFCFPEAPVKVSFVMLNLVRLYASTEQFRGENIRLTYS